VDGLCVDLSRTWLCGAGKPTAEQKQLYQMAYEQICYNQDILKAGKTFREVAAQAKSLPLAYLPNRYTLLYIFVPLNNGEINVICQQNVREHRKRYGCTCR